MYVPLGKSDCLETNILQWLNAKNEKKVDDKLGAWGFYMHESVFWKGFLEIEKNVFVVMSVISEVWWHDDLYKIYDPLGEIF